MTLHLDHTHSPATRFLAQHAAIREHARWAFEVHPAVNTIEFDVIFPTHTEHVTVDRDNMPRLTSDYRGWQMAAENLFERDETT